MELLFCPETHHHLRLHIHSFCAWRLKLTSCQRGAATYKSFASRGLSSPTRPLLSEFSLAIYHQQHNLAVAVLLHRHHRQRPDRCGNVSMACLALPFEAIPPTTPHTGALPVSYSGSSAYWYEGKMGTQGHLKLSVPFVTFGRGQRRLPLPLCLCFTDSTKNSPSKHRTLRRRPRLNSFQPDVCALRV